VPEAAPAAQSRAARPARFRTLRGLLPAFGIGAVTVFGFAPFHLFPLPVLTLALLFTLWERTSGPRARFLLGFAWGLGFFLCGVSWVYVSLHTFGAMPAPLAALSTLLLCGLLALFPGLAGVGLALGGTSITARALLAFPASWTLTEWVRSWLFTGFPWIALGYSQVPDSPLAGYGPVLGVFGVSLAIALSAGLGYLAWHGRNSKAAVAWVGALAALWVGGTVLKAVHWTQPVGEPVSVSLIQGNIPQEMKWREDQVRATLDTYLRLVRSTQSRLVVLPETALPMYYQDVPPEYLARVAAHARSAGADVLIGLPEYGTGPAEYFNSVISFGTSPSQVYRKHHLVPFGEFVPLKPVFGWFIEVVAIPLLDFSRGALGHPPLPVAGQKVAVNICYEDLFGDEIIRQLPEATLLVNASNVAWFGDSLAPAQHLQISQMRALETGRVMLRATNTGMTAVIDPSGRVAAVARPFTEAVLHADVQGYTGSTPFVRWGNVAVLILCGVLLAAAIASRRVVRSGIR
jgi:apolipoprotein N-acyltransferase